MSKSHPLYAPEASTRLDPVAIPAQLRNACIILNEPHASAVAKFGVWDMIALVDLAIYAKPIAAGDRFKVTGNLAWSLAMTRDAKFADDRCAKENEIINAAAKLGLPKSIKELAQFSK